MEKNNTDIPGNGDALGGEDRERMRSAYETAGGFLRAKLGKDAPEDLADLKTVEAADVVVVTGTYDRVEQVLQALQTPFTLISPHDLDRVMLHPQQLLVVNCPGHISRQAVLKVRRFVEAGGSLFTTDWALKHVVEPAFPGILAYNERPTGDEVVRISICTHDNPFIAGVLEKGSDPLWWLEVSSYPIKVLAPERVTVLLSSAELQERYGEAPVAVVFKWGEGDVFHMISHYYLQRSELRSARHAAPVTEFAADLGLEAEEVEGPLNLRLRTGEVESAYSSLKMMQNVILAKKRSQRKKSNVENEPLL